jgi:steroid delta-isomerase-like uncharacterized protein
MAMTNQSESDSIAVPAQLLVREVWSRGDLALVDELVTDDYVEYEPTRSDPIRGPEALKERVAQYRQGIPDLTRTIEEALVDETTVAIHYTATGTHESPLLGIDPTKREIEVDGVFISHVTGGRLAEGTDVWDAFGLLRQLGALPEPITDRERL